MHLLALSAFRPDLFVVADTYFAVSQCTFWCSVLSDVPVGGRVCGGLRGLNAPSGAQCFPTNIVLDIWHRPASIPVSMHLLVLSAFRREGRRVYRRCRDVSMHLLVLSAFRRFVFYHPHPGSVRLNAPSGAQCFPTAHALGVDRRGRVVSMHLLVLSAFRPSCL